jgi:hypothetical protein
MRPMSCVLMPSFAINSMASLCLIGPMRFMLGMP